MPLQKFLRPIAVFGSTAFLCVTPAYAQQYSWPMGDSYNQTYNYQAPAAPPSSPAPVYSAQAAPPSYQPPPAAPSYPYQSSSPYPAAGAYVPPAPSSVYGEPSSYNTLLATRRGFDIGVQAFDYRYSEPSLGVTEDGGMAGFLGTYTYTFGPGYFASLDLRYALGDLDYTGSGTANDKFNDIFETRGLIGKDFIMPRFSVSPYTGLGFRYLYDDNRGLTTTDKFGYRRENELVYLPLGVSPRLPLSANSRLTSDLEYDAVLHGWQTSYLSDGGTGDPDITNQQHSGYGLRANVMYEMFNWSVGPFLNYWDIDTSSSKIFHSPTGDACGAFTCVGTEPADHTIEVGVQFKYHY
jgi:hypothetical protein